MTGVSSPLRGPAAAAAAAAGAPPPLPLPPRVEFQAVILATSLGAALFPLTREGPAPTPTTPDDEDEAAAAPPGGAAPAGSPASAGSSGSSLSAAAAAHAAESIGRAHLPVANRPLLHYQLDMIHRAGFPQVIVVTRESMRRSVGRIVEEWRVARGGAGASAAASVTSPASAAAAAAGGFGVDPLLIPSTPTALQQLASSAPSLAALSLGSSSSCGAGPGLLDIDLVCLETYRGTADALRSISEKLHTDFFCLSGDLISNVQFQNMADLHRSQDAGLIMCVQNSLAAQGAGPGATSAGASAAAAAAKEDAAAVDAQYMGIDEKSGRLLIFKSAADIEESLAIDKRLLARHPDFTLHTHLRDCHLYLFSRWVLYFLASKPSILSIQSELIPCLVSGQYKAKYAEWRHYGKNALQLAALRMSHASRKENEAILYGSAASGAGPVAPSAGGGSGGGLQQPALNRDFSSLDQVGNGTGNDGSRPIHVSGSMGSMVSEASGRAGGAGGFGSGSGPNAGLPLGAQESFRIFVYQASSGTFAQRANTLAAYKALNHELAQDREYAYTPWPTIASDNRAEALQRTLGPTAVAINNYSVIGEGVTFRTEGPSAGGITVKRSCVGRGCIIGAKVKLQGCVVMDGAVIEEGCSLTDCIVGAYAVIGRNCILKDCKIGPDFRVDAATECKGEILCGDD